MQTHYDYLIVGCGLFGATFAERAISKGKSVLIIDKRNQIAGNIYTEEVEHIHVHKFGAHIFHTSYENVWEYVNRFATFNGFINNVIAEFEGKRYHLPFNMNTFHELWGISTAEEAKQIIAKQIEEANIKEITNLEEQVISLVGTDVYKTLVKGYTEKQWGRDCKELPPSIIKRLPVRFEYDNNYFNDKYQGIPIGGYTKMVEKMIKGADVLLGVTFQEFIKKQPQIADKIIFTGPIDEYFDFKLGKLEYRTVTLKTELLDQEDYQGNAVINYTERDVPYTRIIEHKYFDKNPMQKKTIISREYPSEFKDGDEPYYPVNNERNLSLYQKYFELSKNEKNVFFKGRLGEYQYYDMDDIIFSALLFSKQILDS